MAYSNNNNSNNDNEQNTEKECREEKNEREKNKWNETEKENQMEKMNPSNWLLWKPLAYAIICYGIELKEKNREQAKENRS